jgi:3-deoxy-7-phosphoheptulonate synthase
MLIELHEECPAEIVDNISSELSIHPDIAVWELTLRGRRFLVVSGDEALVPPLPPGADRGVRAVHYTTESGYFLIARENKIAADRIAVCETEIGFDRPLWCAAGPCALESVEETIETGHELRAGGAHALRASLFKTRSSPYYFQGKGRPGITELARIRAATALPVLTEVTDPRDVAAVAEVASCLLVDPRNMTNHALLNELGTIDRPVVLMRGLTASVVEWLRAAEYILARGNERVVLCARGVVGLDASAPYAPDFHVIPALRQLTSLPVIYDPSHSSGRASAVAPTALAACAFGADGLLIESCIHPGRMYRPGDAAHMYSPAKLGTLLDACATARELARRLAAETTM